MFADGETEVLNCLNEIPEAAFNSHQLHYIGAGNLLLFDSAIAGRDVKRRPSDFISVLLRSGTYDVATAIHNPNDRMYVVVHRFCLQKAFAR